MRVVVDGAMRLTASEVPLAVLRGLREGLRYRNPKHFWGGAAEPEWLYMLREGPVEVTAPRGAVGLLQSLSDVQFDDARTVGDSFEAEHSLAGGATLVRYQREAVDELVRRVQGVVVVPCGGGKTALALAALARVGRSALVLVHTHDLLEQWRTEVQAQLGIEAGEVSGRRDAPAQPITLAMVQSLTSPGRTRELARVFGVCIVDECHHAPAETFRVVLDAVPCRYRWGLTATPKRNDGLGEMVTMACGPVLYTATVDDLIAAGRLCTPLVYPVHTGCSYAGVSDYNVLLSRIANDDARIDAVAQLVAALVARGRRVLVLSLRVAHCQQLAERAAAVGVTAAALWSKLGKRERARRLQAFREGGCAALVATTLGDEGLDIPAADALVLAMPSRARGRAVQRVGRICRAVAGKGQPLVFDLVDDVPLAARQWTQRRRAYAAEYGKQVVGQPYPLANLLVDLAWGQELWIRQNSAPLFAV